MEEKEIIKLILTIPCTCEKDIISHKIIKKCRVCEVMTLIINDIVEEDFKMKTKN